MIRDIENKVKEFRKRKALEEETHQMKKTKKEEGPKMTLQEQEMYINNLIAENGDIICKIRENILKNELDANGDYIARFRLNTIDILTTMSKMPGFMGQMPPIPVKLNTFAPKKYN
jgi:hypothetical protein